MQQVGCHGGGGGLAVGAGHTQRLQGAAQRTEHLCTFLQLKAVVLIVAQLTHVIGDGGSIDYQRVRLVFENLAVLLKEPQNIEARQKMSLAAFYGGNAINRQLAGYVHAFAHSIGGLYHIPHGEAIAYCLVPVVRAQRGVCAEKLAALSVFCGFADEHDSHPAAIDRLITALRQLLRHCGLPKGCAALREQDYKKLTRLINFDSINYSPSKTFTDEEIHRLLEQIAKGD